MICQKFQWPFCTQIYKSYWCITLPGPEIEIWKDLRDGLSGFSHAQQWTVEVFKERKEGVEREITRYNDANTMAENICKGKGMTSLEVCVLSREETLHDMQQQVIARTPVDKIEKILASAEMSKFSHDFSVLAKISELFKVLEKHFRNFKTFPGFSWPQGP